MGKEPQPDARTMIWPSSPFGILLNCISFTATVSPVAQLSAPRCVRPVGFRTLGTPMTSTYGIPAQTRLFPTNLRVAAHRQGVKRGERSYSSKGLT